MLARNLDDWQITQPGQDIFVEVTIYLRQGTLATGLQAQCPERAPVFEDAPTRVLGRGTGGQSRFTAVGTGIDALGDQRTRLLKADCRVNTEGNARLLARPVEPQAPLLGTPGAHEQRKPTRVFEGAVLTGRFSLASGGIGQGHEYISRLVGSRRCISMPDRGALPKNRCARYPGSMYLKMYLKIAAGGGFRQIALKRKKTPKRLFSMIYRLP